MTTLTKKCGEHVTIQDNKVYYSVSGLTLGKCVGEFICVEDGYYQYFPDNFNFGYLSAEFLRRIADALDECNKEWNDTVNSELSQYKYKGTAP